MSDNSEVKISARYYLLQLEAAQQEIKIRDERIHDLEVRLDYNERLIEQLVAAAAYEEEKKNKKPVTRKKREVSPDTNTYSDFKSNGRRKPHAAESIRSYDDFKAMQNYFIEKDSIRDWMMWTIGVSLGLRISDLFSLRYEHLIDKDKKTVLPRMMIYEQKTGKLNNMLITESVKQALDRYITCIGGNFELDDYIFANKKTGEKMYEEHGWRILSNAAKAIGLPYSVGSHTMRKSFANIAACVDTTIVDMNAFTKVQGLLNHSDQRVTMRYLNVYQDMYDEARIAVSDFVLGRTDINELVIGSRHSIDDVMERLDQLESLLN